jgi:uncharacterized protein YciI
MKHFIVEITYKVPFEELSKIIDEHRAYLDIGYKKKLLLCSGPLNPKTGGIVVARANSLEEIKEYFIGDPYHKKNVAEHKFIEFTPVKYLEFLKDWVG